MREFIINYPGWVIIMYFVISLAIFFMFEYKRKLYDDEYGIFIMFSLLWPLMIIVGAFALPFYAVSKLAKNLRERKKNKVYGTSII